MLEGGGLDSIGFRSGWMPGLSPNALLESKRHSRRLSY